MDLFVTHCSVRDQLFYHQQTFDACSCTARKQMCPIVSVKGLMKLFSGKRNHVLN